MFPVTVCLLFTPPSQGWNTADGQALAPMKAQTADHAIISRFALQPPSAGFRRGAPRRTRFRRTCTFDPFPCVPLFACEERERERFFSNNVNWRRLR
jgi:hypothetical protein